MSYVLLFARNNGNLLLQQHKDLSDPFCVNPILLYMYANSGTTHLLHMVSELIISWSLLIYI